jgi:hypothetical protein
MYLLVLADVAGVQQVFVNGAGAFVVELAVGDAGAMDLESEQGALHGVSPVGRTAIRSGKIN